MRKEWIILISIVVSFFLLASIGTLRLLSTSRSNCPSHWNIQSYDRFLNKIIIPVNVPANNADCVGYDDPINLPTKEDCESWDFLWYPIIGEERCLYKDGWLGGKSVESEVNCCHTRDGSCNPNNPFPFDGNILGGMNFDLRYGLDDRVTCTGLLTVSKQPTQLASATLTVITLIDGTQTRLGGVVVTLHPGSVSNPAIASQITDGVGETRFTNLAHGGYGIIASRDNYETATSFITLEEGTTRFWQVRLSPITQPPPCVENWQCSTWDRCSAQGTQSRTCNDLNNCGTTNSKPSITQSCTPPISPPSTSPPLTSRAIYFIIIGGFLAVMIFIFRKFRRKR